MCDGNAEFMYETELRVRVRIPTPIKSVNNAVYATYMEQARADYFGNVLNVDPDDLEMTVVNRSSSNERSVMAGG